MSSEHVAIDESSELVNRVIHGDKRALAELFDTQRPRLRRIVNFRLDRRIYGRVGADDVLQEAFLKAYEHLDGFKGDSKFYTWIVRIAVNEALMKLRKRRPNVVSLDEDVDTGEDMVPREVEDWGPSPAERFEQTQLHDILNSAISELDPSFRIVFQLRDIEEMSTEETADVLHLSVPAVKWRLLRARLKLRQKLNRYFRRSETA